jgi:hypothetical protein
MKVQVRIIRPPYTDIPTVSLQAILRNHAQNRLNVRVTVDRLYAIMGELTNRRDPSDFMSDEEALAVFRKHYMPYAESSKDNHCHKLAVPHTLTPSPQGKECLGNGHWPGYEC